jgi:hypothetical protein
MCSAVEDAEDVACAGILGGRIGDMLEGSVLVIG